MVSEMSSRRNKIILEEMLSKIDAELAEKDKLDQKIQEDPAAEQLLSKYGSALDNVFYAPDYKVPEGCPKIDLEIRANNTKALYVMIHCKKGLDKSMLIKAANSLRTAKIQATDAILCTYFIDETATHRIFVERNKNILKKYGITLIFSSQPADKYPK